MEGNKNKKIVFFIPSLRGGGAERVMVNMANKLSDWDYIIDFIIAQKEGDYFSDIKEEVNIVNLKASRILFSLFPLIKYLKRSRPQVLIASMEHVVIISVLAKILSFSKTKIIARVANTLSFSLQGTKWYKRWIRKYGAMIFYRFVDEIVANSKGSADDLSRTLKISREKIKVIYNPTDIFNIDNKLKEVVTHPWLKEKDFPVIISVGRLHSQKDFSSLIESFVQINKSAKLIILGEGEERSNLEKLIRELELSERVFMPGFVSNPYAYISRADVFVLSSRWEGLPNVLIEAMACGVPVASTNCPSGPSEILEDGKYGELVPVGDPEKLAEKIEYLLNLSEEKREEITSRARKSVEEKFSIDKMVKEYEKLIN